MVSVNKVLAGSKVYKMGSTVPNKGTSDPSGYIRRELRKGGQQPSGFQGIGRPWGDGVQRGADGQSDTRSGLAANALRNQETAHNAASASRAPQGYQTQVQQLQSRTDPVSATASSIKVAGAGKIKISATGQVHMPFNFRYVSQAMDAKQKAQEALQKARSEYEEQRTQQALDAYQEQANYDAAQVMTAGRHATAGTKFSTPNALNIASDAQAFSDEISQQYAAAMLSDQLFAEEDSSIRNKLQSELMSIALAQSDEDSQNAGTRAVREGRRVKKKKK